VAPDPGAGRGGESGSPSEVFERSSFHQRFLENKRDTRDNDRTRAISLLLYGVKLPRLSGSHAP